MVICRNDPQPGDSVAGSFLYKVLMIQMLVISSTSDYCHNTSVKIWHLYNFNRCYGNKNGQQNRPEIEILSFWIKFKALEDQFF